MTPSARKKYSPVVLGALIFGSLLLVYFFSDREPELVYDSSCVTEEARSVKGNSMKFTLPDGTHVRALKGYFACNPVEHGQIAMLEFKTRPGASYVKRIAGIGGDSLEFEGEHAKLNGELLKNSEGQAYRFSSRSRKLLAIPLRAGEIPSGYFLIVSDETKTNSFDSRTFGYVEDGQLKGLVLAKRK